MHTTRHGLLGEPREQLAADAPALEPVVDDDRDLGDLRLVGDADEARNADDGGAVGLGSVATSATWLRAVDLDQVPDVCGGQVRLDRQEAAVAGLRGEPLVRVAQTLAVPGVDRPDQIEVSRCGQSLTSRT